jgi:hypothetical protein
MGRKRVKPEPPEVNTATGETVNVIFTNTYCGELGVYHKGSTYELPFDVYKLFKLDCKAVE